MSNSISHQPPAEGQSSQRPAAAEASSSWVVRAARAVSPAGSVSSTGLHVSSVSVLSVLLVLVVILGSAGVMLA